MTSLWWLSRAPVLSPLTPGRATAVWWGVLGAGLIGCWWRIRLLGDLRRDLGAFYTWFALAFLLYVLALRLAHRADRDPASERVGVWRTAFAMLLVGLACRLLLLGTIPVFSDDIYRYRWDGRVQAAGISPYAYPPVAEELAFLRDATWHRVTFPSLRTVYPPLAQAAFRLGVAIEPHLLGQKLVFVASELVMVLCLLMVLRRRRRSPLWAVAYAWHPLPVLEIAGSGHNDALGVAMLWLGFAAWESRHRGGTAVAWAGALLAKFASVLLAPWWWARRAGRGWLVVFLALAAGPFLAQPMAATAITESLSAMAGRFESNASLYLLLARGVGSPEVARIIAALCGGAFVIWWGRRQADPVRYFGGAFAAAALLSPVLHPWYLVWLIPLLCFFPSLGWLYFSWASSLVYTTWPTPTWVLWIEYAPLYVLLGVELASRRDDRR